MKLPEITFKFSLLTPAMIGGAEGKTGNPEMRVASIRGHVRWWHRQSGIKPVCHEVWGQTEPSVVASKASLTLLPCLPPETKKVPILPHKQSGFLRDALLPPASHSLVLRRLVGCTGNEWQAAQNAIKVWLLLGGVGLRSNRAAGSVWPEGDWIPANESELKSLLGGLGYSKPVFLADSSLGTTAQELRKAASDTVSVCQYFGGISPRQPSPLKMKVILLGDSPRLLLTGLDAAGMCAARNELGNKDLGKVAWVPL